MAEIGAATLIGIAVTIFLSLITVGISFLYKISVSLNNIENSIDRMNDNLGNKLGNIEESTRESERLLNRISERTRGGNEDQSDLNNNSGDDTGNKTVQRRDEDVEIMDSDESLRSNPEPDVEKSEENIKEVFDDKNTASNWSYLGEAVRRIKELEDMEYKSPSETPDEIIEPAYEEDSDHWVSREAEEISFALSHTIDNSELYLSIAVGEEVTQVNYHVAQAGFPGLVGTDPVQNELTDQLKELLQDQYGENAVLSVHSGQIVVSIPDTDLNNIKDWIEISVNRIGDILKQSKSENKNN